MPQIIGLFGILSTPGQRPSLPSTASDDCHFCLQTLYNNQTYAMRTPCCQQMVHSFCFRTWLQSPHNPTHRCAYCRRPYHYDQYCSLCLKRILPRQRVQKTSCCEAVLHKRCHHNVKLILSTFVCGTVLSCGQSLHCNQLIVCRSQLHQRYIRGQWSLNV